MQLGEPFEIPSGDSLKASIKDDRAKLQVPIFKRTRGVFCPRINYLFVVDFFYALESNETVGAVLGVVNGKKFFRNVLRVKLKRHTHLSRENVFEYVNSYI